MSRQSSVIRNLFGTLAISTQTRFLRLKSIDDEALEDEGYQYERESFARILPAQWLLRLGFKYAYSFSTHDSSTRGWQFCMKPINLVPDDASLFEFCRQGSIEKVRVLISRNLASVRDVDSKGRTALHVSHAILYLFDKAVSQDAVDLTHVVSLLRKIITRSYASS